MGPQRPVLGALVREADQSQRNSCRESSIRSASSFFSFGEAVLAALGRTHRLIALSKWKQILLEAHERLKFGRKRTSPSLFASSSSEAIWRAQQQLKKRSVSLIDGGGAVSS